MENELDTDDTHATIEVATWSFSFRVNGQVPNYRGTERPVYCVKAAGTTLADAQERARQLTARLTDLDADTLSLEGPPRPENAMARAYVAEAPKEND
jgi:hypothetical protein